MSIGGDYFWLGVIVFFLQLLSKFVIMVCVHCDDKHKKKRSKGKTPGGSKTENVREMIEKSRRNKQVEINVMRNRGRTFIQD